MRTILLAALLACAAAAQTLTEPPPLVRLHRSLGPASIRQYANGGVAVNVVGMTAITGRAETWLIEVHDSFAAIEDVDKATHQPASPEAADEMGDQPPNEVLAASRSLIAVYRPAFSYRPEQATQMLRKARYCEISVYHVHPGGEADFVELVKSRRVVLDSINLDRPDISYQVISGAPAGTYLFLAPLASLKVLDDGLAKAPAFAETVAAAAPKSADLTREHLLFRVEPALSWVSDDFASADPAFWHPAAKTSDAGH